MSRYFLFMAVICLGGREVHSAEPGAPNRAITKEPAYKTKEPKYCQLVFGPAAKESVWLVIDGEDLYVDRNGNGDLTEAGERITRKPAFQGSGFEVPELAIGGGKEKYTNLIVYWDQQYPNKPVVKDVAVEVMVEVNQRYYQYAVFKSNTRTPKEAPIIHFGGPLEMKLLGISPALEAGKESDIRTVIGTSSSTGHFAMVRIERKPTVAADLHPIAEITFPSKDPGGKATTTKIELNQRCCNVQFYGPFQSPAELFPGQVKVALSFPAWKEVKVTPTTKEITIAPKSGK